MLAAAWTAVRSVSFWLKIAPYLAAAALLVGVYLWIDHRGYQRGVSHTVAKYQPVMDRALANIRTLKANQAALLAAIDRQNAAVAALKVEGDKRTADGRAALAQAQRANAGLSQQADALRRSAGRKVDDTPCPISETLKGINEI